MATRKPETNQAFVTRLMKQGVLEQAFIISAIDSYARLVKESAPIEHGLIDGRSWQIVADCMLASLKARN